LGSGGGSRKNFIEEIIWSLDRNPAMPKLKENDHRMKVIVDSFDDF
jgi:hypothetical protein